MICIHIRRGKVFTSKYYTAGPNRAYCYKTIQPHLNGKFWLLGFVCCFLFVSSMYATTAFIQSLADSHKDKSLKPTSCRTAPWSKTEFH